MQYRRSLCHPAGTPTLSVSGSQSGGRFIVLLLQPRRTQWTAERFFPHLIKGHDREFRWLITDRLRSFAAANRTVISTLPTRILSMRIIGWKFRIDRPGNKIERCEDFVHPIKRNGFSHSMDSLKISYPWPSLDAGGQLPLHAQPFKVWQEVICACRRTQW